MGAQLECLDRYSMCSGLEVRTPYTDYRLIEYLFNARAISGRRQNKRAVLRRLPRAFCRMKFSAESAIRCRCFRRVLSAVYTGGPGKADRCTARPRAADSPFDLRRCRAQALREKSDRPWFGVRAAEAQLSAYLLQINLWLNRYKVKIDL